MDLQIKNFGPIKEGTIDLSKKFDLFVGYNNSGKTYVAQLLWIIFHARIHGEFLDSLSLDETNAFFKGQSFKDEFEITEEIVEKILKAYTDFLLNKAIPDNFNIKKEHFSLKECSIEFLQIHKNKIFENKQRITRTNYDNKKKIYELKKEKNSKTIHIERHNPVDEWELLLGLLNIVLSLLLTTSEPLFLPAARTFFATFYDYFFRYEKEKREEMFKKINEIFSTKRDLKKEDFSMFRSRYTKPMDDLMSKIFKLNENVPETSEANEVFYKELEKIIGGKILLQRKEGIGPVEFYLQMDTHDKEENNLEMYLASSSVNQLTLLYLFFKYWAKETADFLIIDEPEENLHPDNQMALLELLVKFSGRNRILLTTHSPLLARALNNYLYLGMLKDKKVDLKALIEKEGLNIDPAVNLSPDDVGIYFFDGSRIIPYKVDKYGVLFKNFKQVEREIENISEALTDEICRLDEDEEE